jgi:outer membrane receptor for ferrienterochelin and colicins
VQRAITILFFTIFSLLSVKAQSIRFLDLLTKEPIAGVAVNLASVNDKTRFSGISNTNGEVQPLISFPILIRTSHLGYESIQDTLQSGVRDVLLVPKVKNLDDVIVTGQFNPQSASNSVFRVQTIDSEEFARRGAFTLQEVLTNQLNIRISQDLSIGSASINLQGISGQNVKILVDGVPLVNRSGNGNGADLGQINLENIARIEIVEGPMAVSFGANALAGVINLITKKNFKHKTEINAAVQTETAGPEYGVDAGRHVQQIGVNHRLNESWSFLLSAQHNDFQGFRGGAGARQHEWNPKVQLMGNGLLRYQTDNHNIHYRVDVLDELIEDFGGAQNNFLPSGENQPFAVDETYESKRLSHQIQAEGSLPFLNRYTAFASFSDFQRQKRRFTKDLGTDAENNTTGEGDQDLSTYRVWEFGGTGFLSAGDKADFQLGYQVSLETVGGGRILDKEQSIEEYAIYGSAELRPMNKTTLRPGIRYTINSAFGHQLIPSLQLKYDFTEASQLRLSYGKGFRSPSVREMYFEFVDSNHRVFGNPNLTPEKSNHLSLNATSNYRMAAQDIQLDFTVFYNTIQDQISLGQNINDITSTSYLNIERFRTLGFTLTQKATIGNFSGNLGFSYIGRFNQIAAEDEGLTSFFYSPELNANLAYTFPKSGMSINAFYKYTGVLESYFTEMNDQNNQEISIGKVSDFHWLDVTLVQPIKESFEFVFGVRNVLNVTNINNSGAGGGAHAAGAFLPISYGRSYFLRVNYNLNLK